MTFFDDRTCDWCKDLNGKVVEIGTEYFPKGSTFTLEGGRGMSLDYEDVHAPPLHVSCRCRLEAIYGDALQAQQDMKEEGLDFGFDVYGAAPKTLSDEAVAEWGRKIATSDMMMASAKVHDRLDEVRKMRGKAKRAALAAGRDADYLAQRSLTATTKIMTASLRGPRDRLRLLREAMEDEQAARRTAAVLLRDRPKTYADLRAKLGRDVLSLDRDEYFLWQHGLDASRSTFTEAALDRIDAAALRCEASLRTPLSNISLEATEERLSSASTGIGRLNLARPETRAGHEDELAYALQHEMLHLHGEGLGAVYGEEFEAFVKWETAGPDIDPAKITPHGYSQSREWANAGRDAASQQLGASHEDWAINGARIFGEFVPRRTEFEFCSREIGEQVAKALDVPLPSKLPRQYWRENLEGITVTPIEP
jgi:hypothetical protein